MTNDRDHALRPEWLTEHDPLPQPINGRREEYVSLCRCMIAANAIRRYREDGEDGRVSYSRREGWYAEQPSRFYWPRWFTYSYIIAAVAQLEATGLLVHDKKKPGNRHWQSWFRATEALMKLNTKLQYSPVRDIILRDEDKVDVPYELDKAVLKMKCDVDEVNAYLSKQIITLRGKVLKEGDPLYVDLHCVSGATRIKLRRIFSDRSFYKNGRWQNDIQNIPKEERPWMTLNGHPVKHYDYSAFYPGLLYALAGATCDGDPYTIEGWQREISKPILNILFNTKTGKSAVRAAAQKLKELGGGGSQAERHAEVRTIIAALKVRNEPIAAYFHSDVGKRLMLFESQLLHFNMRALMKLEIPFVPLHDALLVPERKLPVLQAIMEDNLSLYREVLTDGGRMVRNREQNAAPNSDTLTR
jgi:hypothetical protein